MKKGDSIMMTQGELLEAACEIIGVRLKDLSVKQVQGLTALTQRLADLSFNEQRSFDNLCAVRPLIDAALTTGAATDDLVTLQLTKEQCAFLLALIDQGIREHA
jgi:hypothetical protein